MLLSYSTTVLPSCPMPVNLGIYKWTTDSAAAAATSQSEITNNDFIAWFMLVTITLLLHCYPYNNTPSFLYKLRDRRRGTLHVILESLESVNWFTTLAPITHTNCPNSSRISQNHMTTKYVISWLPLHLIITWSIFNTVSWSSIFLITMRSNQ